MNRLPVEITARAARQIREADAWWRRNRPAAPDALRQQLGWALALIAQQPFAGARADQVRLAGVRRTSLATIHYHVYYRVLSAPERVQVLAFWHARRGSGPPL